MKTCTKCGIAQPLSDFYERKPWKLNARCKSCVRALTAADHLANYAKRREKADAWAAAHPQAMDDYKRQWVEKNKDVLRVRSLARYHANKHITAPILSARNKQPHRRKILSLQAQEWRHRNPENVRATVTNRRARTRAANGTHTAKQIEALFKLQKGRCAVCRKVLPRSYHKDHVQPLASGGSNDITNIQLLCAPCNQSKSARDPVAFMQSRGFLL